jgi:hypothetical protein
VFNEIRIGPEFRCKCRARFGVDVGHDDLRTFGDEAARVRRPHAARGSRDQCDFTLQSIHKVTPDFEPLIGNIRGFHDVVNRVVGYARRRLYSTNGDGASPVSVDLGIVLRAI